MSLKRRLNILNNPSGESAVLTDKVVLVEGAEKLDDVSCLNEPSDTCSPSTSSLENESGSISGLTECSAVNVGCTLPSGSCCLENISPPDSAIEAPQQSLRDCLEKEHDSDCHHNIIEHFEIPTEVIVDALAASLPSASSCNKHPISSSRGTVANPKHMKSPRKPIHSRDVTKSDILSGSQVIQEGRTYGIDPEKNYFRIKNQLKEVRTYCFVCRKKASRVDSIHPPKNAAILKSWLKSLSGGDPTVLAHLEERLKMAIVDNVLCSDHYDTSKTTFYLLGTKLPVVKFTRDSSSRLLVPRLLNYMDHVTLHQRLKQFEQRIRKWKQTRFGALIDTGNLTGRRSASQDPRKALNLNCPSATNSPLKSMTLNPIGSRTCPISRKELGLNLTSQREDSSRIINNLYNEVEEKSGYLTLRGKTRRVEWTNLTFVRLLGSGCCGEVSLFKTKANEVMAVKVMTRTDSFLTNKRILMDLKVMTKSIKCPYIVSCYGYFINEVEVRLCMEALAKSFDDILKKIRAQPSLGPIPLSLVQYAASCVVRALSFLKDELKIIHRDVKPSNFLLDYDGRVKLCDFGISGELVGSLAKTRVGCPPYMAPERLEVDANIKSYDIRSDVWSLGISIVELGTGAYPYGTGLESEFDILARISNEEPPFLQENGEYPTDLCHFTRVCLLKNVDLRPTYKNLITLPYIQNIDEPPNELEDWLDKFITTDES